MTRWLQKHPLWVMVWFVMAVLALAGGLRWAIT